LWFSRNQTVTWTLYIASLAFFPIEGQLPVIQVGWTLNYEMYFYVITVVSVFLAYPFGPIFSIFTLVAGVLAGVFWFPGYYLWTDPLLLNFAVGNVLAVLFYRGVALAFTARVTALIAAAVLLYLGPYSSTFVRFFTYGPAIGLVVATLTLRDVPFSIGKADAVFNWIGSRSYTLYLSHLLILKVVEKSIYHLIPELHPWLYLAIAPPIAVAACGVLYKIIEQPLTAHLKEYRWTTVGGLFDGQRTPSSDIRPSMLSASQTSKPPSVT
jgi:exopolysaccharide production protein ExoZ